MLYPDMPPAIEKRFYSLRLSAALAAGAIILSGCNETPVPSHTVVVQEGQTLDDIGTAECGPSPMGMTILPRRNHLRKFNDLPDNTVETGQTLQIPDTLCSDTGDRPE